MLRSPAWALISNSSRVAYLHIKEKCVSPEPGELTLSFKEMERIMRRKTFARALDELERFGFIKRTQRGGLYRKRNYFTLIDEWKKFQTQVRKSVPVKVISPKIQVRKSVPYIEYAIGYVLLIHSFRSD
jgi:DNA-binding transcriptional regulator YhcF (GntR family)